MSLRPEAYHHVSLALEQSGLTADEFMKMHHSHSSNPSTKQSQKRKSIAAHDPRSVSTSNFKPTQPLSRHDIAALSTTEMNRHHGVSVQSAPAAVALSREPSRTSNSMYHPHPPALRNDGGMSSRRTSKHIDGTWQSPAEYFAHVNVIDTGFQAEPSYTTTANLEQYPLDPAMLSATSMHANWSPVPSSALDSPRYSIDYTDPLSLHSTNMSRDQTRSSFSSVFPDLQDGLAMLRVKSDASYMSPSDSQSRHPAPFGASQHPYPPQFVHDQHQSPSTAYLDAQQASFDSSSEEFNFAAATEGFPEGQPYAAPPMHRDLSSCSSSSKASSTSRSQKRHRETIQQSQRSIAPALSHQTSSSSKKNEPTHQQLKSQHMVRVTSENGEEKVYGVIPKNTERQKRVTAPKLTCPQCNDHPDGFRGEHELQRHVMRAHAKIRKVWICVDSSENKSFLSNCKACRTKKRYGAYYNAAAHLRRTHFNPRKKGRRTKGEEHEKRGGKGGGHWPPMNHLKDNWMKEVEEIVTDDLPLPDDLEGDAGEEIGVEQPDEFSSPDFLDMPHLDSNALSYAGANFDNSPIVNTCSPIFANDMGMNMAPVNFADMMLHCEGDLMSQAAGTYGGNDMFIDPSQAYLQHAMAFEPMLNGPM